MFDTAVEKKEIRVPLDTGMLIGNTLRQFAMRGVSTWQPAAYKIGTKEGTFGLSGGYDFSVLEFSKGRLISQNESGSTLEMLCRFELSGKDYVCDDMVITNLGNLGAPSLNVCLVKARGSRTMKQNFEVVKRLCPSDIDDYIVVSSKHTPAIVFRFEVVPYDQMQEILVIESTPGVIEMARDSVVQSVSGLHI